MAESIAEWIARGPYAEKIAFMPDELVIPDTNIAGWIGGQVVKADVVKTDNPEEAALRVILFNLAESYGGGDFNLGDLFG